MTYSAATQAGFGYTVQSQPQAQVFPSISEMNGGANYNRYGYFYQNQPFNYSRNFNYFPTNNIQIGLNAPTPESTPASTPASVVPLTPVTPTPMASNPYSPILFTSLPPRVCDYPEIEKFELNVTRPSDDALVSNTDNGKYIKQISNKKMILNLH